MVARTRAAISVAVASVPIAVASVRSIARTFNSEPLPDWLPQLVGYPG
jgi:hypothetical protein